MNLTSRILILFYGFTLYGCASMALLPPIPVTGKQVSVQVLEDAPGMNDYPIGAYTIPNSQVIITKPRQISTGEGAFGALGVLAAHSSGKKDSKALIEGHETALGLSLKSPLENAVKLATADSSKAWIVGNQSGQDGRIELAPFAYISPDEAGNGTLFMFMKANYYDAKGSKMWSSRYIYQHKDIRPIRGEASWTSNDAQYFRKAIDQGYRDLANVMIKDSDRAGSGWRAEPATLKAPFFTAITLELKGEVLQKTDHTVIFNAGNGGILHGINVVPRNSVEILPAT